ncbi:hypothetical protein JAAARDRAFT_33692 [Jaapia argillacea MUCL 33604]|uniref:Isochorismatase-like domain-containing protein n=1 Tax=Jaapia argillacea MUCL 33604 TaxID=933084 RepID=A0A067Q673_9AGAM|nr:hypothetical protein JAAARDRAFT_33692 [Jaapia argillacea MUCL 33604]
MNCLQRLCDRSSSDKESPTRVLCEGMDSEDQSSKLPISVPTTSYTLSESKITDTPSMPTLNGSSQKLHADHSSSSLSHHPHHCRVLLLLDTQVSLLSPQTGVPAALNLRQNISQILSEARQSSPRPLIIHVRNSGDVGEPDEPNTPGWQLLFTPLSNEPVIDKLKNNAFAGTKLGELIRPDAEIVVVGMQSDFCVRATCSAALGRGNEVLLIRGAHGTYDRIEVWNGGGITPAATIESEIEEELEEAGVILLDMKDLPGIFSDR